MAKRYEVAGSRVEGVDTGEQVKALEALLDNLTEAFDTEVMLDSVTVMCQGTPHVFVWTFGAWMDNTVSTPGPAEMPAPEPQAAPDEMTAMTWRERQGLLEHGRRARLTYQGVLVYQGDLTTRYRHGKPEDIWLHITLADGRRLAVPPATKFDVLSISEPEE